MGTCFMRVQSIGTETDSSISIEKKINNYKKGFELILNTFIVKKNARYF